MSGKHGRNKPIPQDGRIAQGGSPVPEAVVQEEIFYKTLPKLQTFTEGMVKSMEKSAIPESLLTPFGYLIPIAEFVIGLVLLIGYQTKYTIYAGLALMGLLVLGSASVENWSAIEAQLIHSIYLGGLLWYWEKYRPASTHKSSKIKL
ncbi:hypothetical protein D3C87_604920 [compost metagenome]